MNAPTDSTTDAAAARRQRVEELQRRRSPAPAESPRHDRPARSGAAQSTKIAAAGLGFATMFGLVAAITVAGSTSAVTPAAPAQTAPPAQVVVVIHRADGTTDTAVPAGSTSVSSAAVPTVVAASPAQPIVLTAQPTVVQAPASQAPAAQTHGSR